MNLSMEFKLNTKRFDIYNLFVNDIYNLFIILKFEIKTRKTRHGSLRKTVDVKIITLINFKVHLILKFEIISSYHTCCPFLP